jgi:hypothetical protein
VVRPVRASLRLGWPLSFAQRVYQIVSNNSHEFAQRAQLCLFALCLFAWYADRDHSFRRGYLTPLGPKSMTAPRTNIRSQIL